MGDRSRLSVAFISVGSNIKPERNILAALRLLTAKIEVRGSSRFYRTEPIGRPDQPMFVNGVWQIRTDLEPVLVQEELLRPVEHVLDRRRTEDEFAPRTIDLDLVLYDDLVCNERNVRLPHPDIARPFVCGPILELLEQNAPEIEPELKDRIIGLLPQDTAAVRPGEIVTELTQQLRRWLAQQTSIHYL